MPIVLGGPWAKDGEVWERWGYGGGLCNPGAWQGMEYTRHDLDQWGYLEETKEIHAPKGWIPTPDTIPEGCYIKTPEGVERRCGTCVWGRLGGTPCRKAGCEYGRSKSPSLHAKWCPAPTVEKPEKQEFKVGQWVWRLTGTSKGMAAQLVSYNRKAQSVHKGDVWNIHCPAHTQPKDRQWTTNNFRPIRVGDKVKVVDEPRSHTLTPGYKGQITLIDTEDGEVPLQVDGTWANTEDIRLLED